MKKKPLAIAFSDLHINLWAKFNNNNERTLNQFKVLHFISGLSDKLKAPVLFCGDFFHKPDGISIELLNLLHNELPTFKEGLYAISGNHDLKFVNHIEAPIESLVTQLDYLYHDKGIRCIDRSTFKFSKDGTTYEVLGVPYIDHNLGVNEFLKARLDLEDKNIKHLLLLHTDYPGARDTDGRRIDSVENLNINILNKFDLVLCGHIHKPQKLGKKIYMIGAPNHQRRTDRDCDMGIWIIYSDLSMKFKHLSDFPRFIDVESEEDVKDDGNYYTILPKKASIIENTPHKITKQLSKKSLARRYMKAKGIKDNDKKQLLIDILNKVES